MKLQNFTYRMQIFLTSLILIIIPSIVLGITTANSTAKQVNNDYQDMLNAITTQTNLNLDTLLSDAEKIAYLHIINDDIREAMVTNYQDDMMKLAKDTVMMKTQITQANRLNTNVISSIFVNKYGYTFDYNINSNRDYVNTLNNIALWSKLARGDDHYSYFGPIQYSKYTGNYNKNILPMVKILKDINNNSEIGIFYVGINFDAVAKILETSKLPNSKMAFFNQDDALFFSSDEGYMSDTKNATLIGRLEQISRNVSEENPMSSDTIRVGSNTYTVNAVYNKTTGWKVIHFMDSSIISNAYGQNIRNYVMLFVLCIPCDMLLAYLLSRGLTRSIGRLCTEIDACEGGDISTIDIHGTLLNRELCKVVDSYNRLNLRLTESIKQNYTIRLNEKQMKLRMLQFQINPHFLYNTLNLISSIAHINNIPEIKTITTSMSDILRYNLKSGPTTILKDEIKQINQYISIQQIRFLDKFTFECIAPEELLQTVIPAFILQPIVENAIGHGLDERETGGYIGINIFVEQEDLHILIADNGTGIQPLQLQNIRLSLLSDNLIQISNESDQSIGILNVHQRIQAYYGKEYGLLIDSAIGRGTIIDIKLPLYKKPIA